MAQSKRKVLIYWSQYKFAFNQIMQYGIYTFRDCTRESLPFQKFKIHIVWDTVAPIINHYRNEKTHSAINYYNWNIPPINRSEPRRRMHVDDMLLATKTHIQNNQTGTHISRSSLWRPQLSAARWRNADTQPPCAHLSPVIILSITCPLLPPFPACNVAFTR